MAAAAGVAGSPYMGKDPRGPASGSIEVEQKFLYGPGTEEKLLALGATLEGRSSFRDRYYDTPNWGLTLADHWLREREGAGWELKCPPQLLEDSSSGCATHLPTGSQRPRDLPHGLQPLEGGGRLGAATQYQEVTCAQAILTHVCGLLGVAPLAAWHNDMARAVSELGLEEFASFVTCRRRYRLGNLHVDLDAADFGYNVGEVEAVVGQLENVSEATAWIQPLGSQLGLDAETRIPGKMSVYLHQFRPAHYAALVEAGMLRKVGGCSWHS